MMSAGFILEEGFPRKDLKRITRSMAEAARTAGVSIVTGNTKADNHRRFPCGRSASGGTGSENLLRISFKYSCGNDPGALRSSQS